MMRVAGVDCGGSKVAIAILERDELYVHCYEAKTADRHAALKQVGEFAAHLINHCDVVYIEQPVVGRGVAASLMVAQATGAVMARSHVPTYFVNISKWKKQVTGAGNASKGLVANTLSEFHPGYSTICGGNQDLVDATCIALYGQQQHRVVERLRAHDQLRLSSDH